MYDSETYSHTEQMLSSEKKTSCTIQSKHLSEHLLDMIKKIFFPIIIIFKDLNKKVIL